MVTSNSLPAGTAPWSWPAILSIPAGLMMCFSWGTLGIVLGVWGLWQTRGARRRGHRLAKWGLFMGCLSLLFALSGFPASFYVPPLREHDRQFQMFLDDVAAGRWEQAQANPLCQYVESDEPTAQDREDDSVSAMPPAMFQAWGRYFRAKHGRGRILFAHHFAGGGDQTSAYTIRFERAPMRRCWLVQPDPPQWQWWIFDFGWEGPGDIRDGESALHLAARNDEPEVTEELIRQGEDVDALDGSGMTPLDAVCNEFPRGEAVYYILLQHGALGGRLLQPETSSSPATSGH